MDYSLDDPRPLAKSAPYTFFLPSQKQLSAVSAGDLVKLIFRPIPADRQYDAERMWVLVDEVTTTGLRGRLQTEPTDMPQLSPGAVIGFQEFHITAVAWNDEKNAPPDVPDREYWDRCLVDRCVFEEGVPVSYLYREEPDMAEKSDRYPDSGWRIRGDDRGLSDAEVEARKASYVALGVVLNADDTWLHLVEEPVGSAFLRDFDTDEYVRETG